MEQSATPPPPPTGEPPDPAGPPDPLAPASPWRTGATAPWLLGLAAVGVALFFVGRATVNRKAAYDRGFDAGQSTAQGRFRPGSPRYRRVYDTGYRAGLAKGLAQGRAEGLKTGRREGEARGAENGRKAGLEQGRQIGTLTGEREGIASGAGAALGGFASWDTGSWYLVELATGAQGVTYRIASRTKVAADQRYALCAKDTSAICTEPIRKR